MSIAVELELDAPLDEFRMYGSDGKRLGREKGCSNDTTEIKMENLVPGKMKSPSKTSLPVKPFEINADTVRKLHLWLRIFMGIMVAALLLQYTSIGLSFLKYTNWKPK